jgi:hypothetical protein
MSTMLEQAVVDANALREAALKSAESAIVEKYSSQVKDAMTQLLEQDEDSAIAGLSSETPDDQEEVDQTAIEGVPMAHLPGDEDTVIVDLRDILDAVDSDEPSADDAVDATRDHAETADNIGLSLDDAPANRDDDEEIDIDEKDLVEMFKEILVVDIPQIQLNRTIEKIERAKIEEDDEDVSLDKKIEDIRTDGMDADDIAEYERTMAKNESLNKENRTLKKLARVMKEKLEDINLQNARLFYANRVLSDTSLNEQQKSKIADVVGNANTVEEAKMVFETLQKTMADTRPAGGPKSLSEAITKRSSIILGGSRHQGEEKTPTSANPTYNRWAALAGTKRTD